MHDLLRYCLIIGCGIAAIAKTTLPTFAASCAASGANDFRQLAGGAGESVLLSEQAGQLSMCVRSSKCVWHIALQSRDSLGSYAKEVNDIACPPTIKNRRWRDGTYLADCQMNARLSGALRDSAELYGAILGKTPCGTLASPLENQAVIPIVDSVPVFMGSVPIGKLCLTVGIQLSEPNRAFISLVQTCPTNDDSARMLAKQWFGVSPEKYSLGASYSAGLFGYTGLNPPFHASQAEPIVSGSLNTPYLKGWLQAIVDSSARVGAPLASNAPLEASDNNALGRVANWLAAGLLRLNAKPFDLTDPNRRDSVTARDWMARTYLGSPDQFAGTLLRAEKARTDWGPP